MPDGIPPGRISKESGKSTKDVLAERLVGIPTWQPAPTFEGVKSGDWASPVLDLSVYPSQVALVPRSNPMFSTSQRVYCLGPCLTLT